MTVHSTSTPTWAEKIPVSSGFVEENSPETALNHMPKQSELTHKGTFTNQINYRGYGPALLGKKISLYLASNSFILPSTLQPYNEKWDGLTLFVDVLYNNPTFPFPHVPLAKRIFVAMESPEISKDVKPFLLQNQDRFGLILTYNEDLLKKLPADKVQKFVYGTNWVLPPLEASLPKKEFLITHWATFKNWIIGHQLRQILYFAQKGIKHPACFYRGKMGQEFDQGSSNPCLPSGFEDRSILFEKAMFSIVIENCSVPNYFTEKLVDCFLYKTIPIYYGAPNIGEYFNVKGMVILPHNANIQKMLLDFKGRINALTKEDYALRAAAVEENYHKALTYTTKNRIKELHQIINKHLSKQRN